MMDEVMNHSQHYPAMTGVRSNSVELACWQPVTSTNDRERGRECVVDGSLKALLTAVTSTAGGRKDRE